MMRRLTRSFFFLVLVAVALNGCSTFSKQSRQQRNYEKYIRKSSLARAQQQSHFRTSAPPMPPQPVVSEPLESTETSPQAVPSDQL